MKPLKLVMEGVRSFVERQEIDFEALGNLFCICGKTGAGKSSILDSIIFALYGSVSRDGNKNKDFVNLRCERAYVAFDFTAEYRQEICTLRVERSIYRSERGAKAKLTDLSKSIILADRVEDTNKILSGILGLDMHDFLQVVILEQGKFAEFLSASSAERTQTVTNLFKLNKYDSLSRKFNAEVKTLTERLSGYDRELESYKDCTSEAINELKRVIKDKESKLAEDAKKYELLERRRLELEALKAVYDRQRKDAERAEQAAKERQRLCEEIDCLTQSDYLKEGSASHGTALAETAKICDLEVNSLREFESVIKEREEQQAKVDSERDNYRCAKQIENQAEKRYAEINREYEAASTALLKYRDSITCGLTSSDIAVEAEKWRARAANYDQAIKTINDICAKIVADQDMRTAEQDIWERMSEGIAETEVLRMQAETELAAARLRYEDIRRENAVGEIGAALSIGDNCPVCGNTISVLPNISMEDDLQAKEAVAALEMKIKRLNDKLSEAMTVKAAKAVSIERLNASIGERSIELDRAKQLASVADGTGCKEMLRLLGEAATYASKTEEYDEKRKELKSLLEKEQLNLTHTTERGKEAKARFDEIDSKVKARLGEDEYTIVLAKVIDRANEARRALDEWQDGLTAANSALTAKRTELAKVEGILAELTSKTDTVVRFDDLEYANVNAELESLRLSRDNDSAQSARLQERLVSLQDRYEYKRGLETSRKEVVHALDLNKQLAGLMYGGKFKEYVAEEYVERFTRAASRLLGELSSGKYEIEYCDGSFSVRDFLASNMVRPASTLSGGERFLASLSLAMAISREIATHSSYEFFFLDEGFGTLDGEYIDIVAEALTRLSGETMVGVVTHRIELTERISAKVEVEHATETSGSRIKVVP